MPPLRLRSTNQAHKTDLTLPLRITRGEGKGANGRARYAGQARTNPIGGVPLPPSPFPCLDIHPISPKPSFAQSSRSCLLCFLPPTDLREGTTPYLPQQTRKYERGPAEVTKKQQLQGAHTTRGPQQPETPPPQGPTHRRDFPTTACYRLEAEAVRTSSTGDAIAGPRADGAPERDAGLDADAGAGAEADADADAGNPAESKVKSRRRRCCSGDRSFLRAMLSTRRTYGCGVRTISAICLQDFRFPSSRPNLSPIQQKRRWWPV